MKKLLSLSTLAFLLSTLSAFADLSITPTSVQSSEGPTCKYLFGKAGATIAAGQTVYFDGTSGQNNFKLADADASAAASKVVGIALIGGATGQKIRVCTYDPSFTLGATVVIGDTIWLSTTAGGMTKVASEGVATGSYVGVLGVAISTTKIFLNPTRAGAVKP